MSAKPIMGPTTAPAIHALLLPLPEPESLPAVEITVGPNADEGVTDAETDLGIVLLGPGHSVSKIIMNYRSVEPTGQG